MFAPKALVGVLNYRDLPNADIRIPGASEPFQA